MGTFLVIEGAHGTGKTTLSKALTEALKRRGYSVSCSIEPFSAEIAQLLEKHSKHFDPHVINHLVLADRFLHVQFLTKALNMHDFVISTRYTPSSFVYQRISGIQPRILKTFNKDFLKFDKMVMLNTTYQTRISRIKQRAKPASSSFFMKEANLKLEQKYYSAMCRKMKNCHNILVIDSILPEPAVLEKVLQFLNVRLEKIA